MPRIVEDPEPNQAGICMISLATGSDWAKAKFSEQIFEIEKDEHE